MIPFRINRAAVIPELWQPVGRANADFNLIEEGDHIAIGLSGGKDSSTLVWMMHEWRKFSPIKFKITAITLDMGWDGDLSPFVRELGLPVLQNPCPANGCTKRQDMKDVISFWEKYNPQLHDNLLGALKKQQYMAALTSAGLFLFAF